MPVSELECDLQLHYLGFCGFVARIMGHWGFIRIQESGPTRKNFGAFVYLQRMASAFRKAVVFRLLGHGQIFMNMKRANSS